MPDSFMPDRSGPLPARLLRGFGHFWVDFLIGDTPEVFVGVVAVLVLVGLVCLDHSLRTMAAVALPVLVALLLAVSVWRGARTKGR
jgi:hypothetical protein